MVLLASLASLGSAAPAALGATQSQLAAPAFVQQGPKLTALDEVGAGTLGATVALSADGNTALVGAPEDDNFAGAVWVFVRTNSGWSQEGPKLTGDGELGAGEFGASVDLSADGKTALIGGPADGTAYTGAAWVFTRSGDLWTDQAKLTASDETRGVGETMSAAFGTSVSIADDGNTALIGGPVDSGLGAAWVFTRSGSTWTQQGSKLTGLTLGPAFTEEPNGFGQSVALSGDGNTALIGAPSDSWFDGAFYDNSGSAWVFTHTGSTWTEQGPKLIIKDASGELGSAVALSADGNTALVSGPDTSVVASPGATVYQGAAWVFTRSGTTWSQQGPELTPSDQTPNSYFGLSLALSPDGNTALISGCTDSNQKGAAWLFSRAGSTWTQQSSKLTPNDETGGGLFARSVALSANADTLFFGGDLDSNFVGAAWAFTMATAPDAPSPVTAAAGDGQATVAFSQPTSNTLPAPTSYTVTASPGGEAVTGDSSPITVPGLTNGVTYTFTVTATNGVGTSPASAPSNPVTPAVASNAGAGPGPPDLALTLSASASHVVAGGQATFTFAVSDPDGKPDGEIHMLVTLPAGAAVDATSSDRGTGCTAGAAAGTLDCSLGFIYPPLVAHITITLTLTTVGQATLAATVSGAEVEKNTSNNTASATVQVDSPPITTSPAPTPHPVVKKPAATTFTIVGVKPVHLGKKPLLHVTMKVSKTSEVTLVLIARNGRTVAQWRVHLPAGTKKLALALPLQARHAGRDTLRVQVGTGRTKTVTVAIDSGP